MIKKTTLLLFLMLLAIATGDIYADAITGVSVVGVSSEYRNSSEGPYTATKLIGGKSTGLNINGPGTHSTVSANRYSTGRKGTMWMSNGLDNGPQYIIFDLGEASKGVGSIKIWNWNDPVDLNRGVRDLKIYVSDTKLPYGDTNWTLKSSVVLDKAPGNNTTAFGQEVSIDSPDIRYVLFEVMSNYRTTDNLYSGLSEVVFYTVPEPTTSTLTASGLMRALCHKK